MKKNRIIIILLCIILFILIGVSYCRWDICRRIFCYPVYVKAEVSVTKHKITSIKIIEHENGLGDKAEKIVDDVISRQSLKVDAASGATVRSKCIIKAVENALQYGSK